MMQAGLQFIACSLFPECINPLTLEQIFAISRTSNEIPRLPAIQAPGPRDPSSSPYMNSRTLRFSRLL